MKRSAVMAGAVLLALLLAVLVLTGYTGQEPLPGKALTGAVSDHTDVLLFEPCGDTPLFAYTDSTTHILAADGSRACSTTYPGRFAFLRGSAVTVLCPLEDTVAVQRFDAASLTQTDFFDLEVGTADIQSAEADAFGRLFLTLYSEPTEILVFDAAGSYTGSLLYAEPIRDLQILDSTLFVLLSSSGERIALSPDFPQTGAETFAYPASARPYRMLNRETYIDKNGFVRTLDGAALLDTGLNPLGARLTALQGDTLFWASDSSTVSATPLYGGTVAVCPVRSTLEAITAQAAVSRQDGVFYYTVYDFPTEPTASPTPSPTPSPVPDTDEVTFGEGCLFTPEGMTCAALRDALSPREVQVYTAAMAPASGSLRTGYTALVDGTPYTVVLRGDLNGSGTVNSADLRLLQRVLAEDEALTDAARLAADLNADGSISAADLVLLAARIGA